ncbi:hypothetical protein PY093_05075 [Cytobacillus sp. S13-E01]|uniref:hypothetical protein n=1 Tax=Cytobacillus sp. S13-E01 TaxID=3031326 RepID=UPI0023D8146D|nr:hypothetical protein [Cytobacillus sp. S13-E01]MDF0726085.1 hypothetical protein [Cytobacillus sp. S13-E01]
MMQLSEAQFEMVDRYNSLLHTVEEAFEYVVESFENYERTQGDQVLADIFSALSQIRNTNENLVSLFREEKALVTDILKFEAVIKEVEKLEIQFEDQTLKQQLIKTNIFPAFQAWKLLMQKSLEKYTNQ